MSGAEKTFDDEFDKHLHRLFYVTPIGDSTKCDPSVLEYFGVLSLTDLRSPGRKLWYIYYCKQPEVEDTLNRLFLKYGKKNMCEIFRKHTFNGVGFRARVKSHFFDMKWRVKGNILEAPPKISYNNDSMCKTLTALYNVERRMLYNYICMKHNGVRKYFY